MPLKLLVKDGSDGYRKNTRDKFLVDNFSRLFADPNSEAYNSILRVLLDNAFVFVYEELTRGY